MRAHLFRESKRSVPRLVDNLCVLESIIAFSGALQVGSISFRYAYHTLLKHFTCIMIIGYVFNRLIFVFR